MKRLLTIVALLALALAGPAAANIPGFSNNIFFGNNGSLTPPVALWLMSNYSATPSPNVPNSESSVAVSQNLLRAPRRLFSNVNWWNASGVTVTDNNATAPDGTMQASTFVASGAWDLYYEAGGAGTFSVSLPAGTYTLSCGALGSSQAFKYNINNGTSPQNSPTKTATSSWARYPWTFTVSGSSTWQIYLSGSGAINAEFVDCGLYSGSSDPGEPAPAGHMYLGGTAWNSLPTRVSSNHALDFGSGLALEQLPSISTYGAITTMAVIDCSSPPSNGLSFAGYLQDANSMSNFAAATQYGGVQSSTQQTPNLLFDGTATIYNQQNIGLFNICANGPTPDIGYHVITHILYPSGIAAVWFDDVPIGQSGNGVPSSAGAGNASIGDLITGNVVADFIGGHYNIAAIAVWNRALGNSEIYAQVDNFIATLPLSMSLYSGYFFWTGDSIAAGAGVPGNNANYTGLTTLKSGQYHWLPRVGSAAFAVSGTGLVEQQTVAPYIEAVIPPASRRGSRKFFVDSDVGINDMGMPVGGTVATEAAGIDALCAAYASAGFTAPLQNTLINRADSFATSTVITNQLAYNALLNGGSMPDCLPVNLAGDQFLGEPGNGAANNTLVYADKVHPTQFGAAIYETYVENVLTTYGSFDQPNPGMGSRFYSNQTAAANLVAIAGGM